MPRQSTAASGAVNPLRALAALVRLTSAPAPKDVDHSAALCRVCAWYLDDAGWTLDGPTHTICDCCGAESGIDDTTPERIIAYRRRWTRGGHVWFDPTRRPAGWSYDEGLPSDTQDRSSAARH
ncbi:hypothetical protein EQW78_10250 [Oerskovia turbata]|uniref:Cysteine-rich CPCC domain-containing protein n=1 Tax=Oerskovia turbata TaxID=1713 RepID=A0A4Q1KUQ7_9CELL|nr:hypothetical protein [Oerskovia turbata]RXR25378.1 hypothetical protein EQW73_11065 [Oerskovia turbata]RXR33981.1 hypothetical protein EQW78_10250 [Oerskovia turbata]TGJ95644.1 hypothetical protein DLJ96_14070 [Actinotalea fermentans ATCC 43279 = JCM 9966 = DSM 3133]